MKLPRSLSAYHRRLLFYSCLYLVGSLIAIYGIMVTIKTDTLNAQTRSIKQRLVAQKEINDVLSAKIQARANLKAVDDYATQKLKMAPPKKQQVILLE